MKHLFFIFAITICISYQLNAQPTPIYPTGNINTLTPLMNWNDVQGAISYRVQVFHGATVIIDTTPAQSQYQVLPGVLDSNSLYYWRVKAFYPIGESGWSTQFGFSTFLGGIPSAPEIIYPCNIYHVPITPTLDWTDVPGAITYRIQISLSPVFLTVYYDVGGLTASQYLIQPGLLNYGILYHWRVNATNAMGTGPWSSICYFGVIGPQGIKIISSEVPTEYKLYNNYPNPFNPITNVKFQMSNGCKAKIIVFDMLGKEIATLVNEQLQAGIYETNWDASQFPSGIYFYRLTAGDPEGSGQVFIETKKMILLK